MAVAGAFVGAMACPGRPICLGFHLQLEFLEFLVDFEAPMGLFSLGLHPQELLYLKEP